MPRDSSAKPSGDAIHLPARIAPMLSQSTTEPFDSPQHLFEIKWDGVRALAIVDSHGLRVQNRRFVELLPRYPEMAVLAKLPPGTVLDGEVVVLAGGKPSFAKLAQRDHVTDAARVKMLSQRLPATYIAFDVLYIHGENVMSLPLIERKSLVAELVGELASPTAIACDFIIGRGKRYFEEVEKIGLEGIMAKRLASPYRSGKRSDDWIKIKVARDAEFDVIGFTLQEGTRDTVGALLLGEKQGGKWLFRGRVGTGFTERQRREFFSLLNRTPPLPRPLGDAPKEGIWRRTGKRCAVRYFEKTEHGMLRGPVFHGWTRDEIDA